MQEREAKLNSIGHQSLYHCLSVCMEELRSFFGMTYDNLLHKKGQKKSSSLSEALPLGWME